MKDYLLLCLIYILFQQFCATDGRKVLVTTQPKKKFSIFPIQTTYLTFKVKSEKEACLAFLYEKSSANPTYQVCLGTNDNKESSIFYGNSPTEKVKTMSNGILNENEYRSFWLWKYGSTITVGREGENCPFLSWTNEKLEPADETLFLGVKTTLTQGQWNFQDDLDAQLPQASEVQDPYDGIPRVLQTITTSGSFENIVWFNWSYTGVNFKVKAYRDAQVLLSTQRAVVEPYNRITLGGTQSAMDCPNCESVNSGTNVDIHTYMIHDGMINDDVFVSFWLLWANGKVMIGYRGNKCPFLSFTDHRKFKVTSLGFRTIDNPGTWKIEVPIEESDESSENDTTEIDSIEVTTKENPYFVIPNNTEEIVLDTEANGPYHYFPVYNADCFYFKVRSKSSVSVGLAYRQENDTDKFYQVVLGDNGNSMSYIRRNKVRPDPAVEAPTASILSADELRGFWICWNNGSITVGRANQQAPILSWCDPNPFDINYIAITGGKPSHWMLYVPKSNTTIPPTDSTATVTEPEEPETTPLSSGEDIIEIMEIETKNKSPYHFLKWSDYNFVEFQVMAPHDAHVCLSPEEKIADGYYKVYIGGTANTKTSIHRNSTQITGTQVHSNTDGVLSADEYRGFWIFWTEVISVGNEGDSCPLVTWCDPNPIPVNYIGLRTNHGSNGFWKVKMRRKKGETPPVNLDFTPSPYSNDTPTYHKIDTPNNKNYTFFKWTSKMFRFRVKTKQDAHIVLSVSPDESSPHYRIYLGSGNNTKSEIEKFEDETFLLKIKSDTPNILSEENFVELRIRWHKGIIEVGNTEGSCPVLSWCDKKPISIKYVGIRTLWTDGAWEIEGLSDKPNESVPTEKPNSNQGVGVVIL